MKNDVTFSFSEVSENYILDLLNSLPENMATGVDEIPAKLLKASADEIVSPLTYMVNLSITTGSFPTQWKKARIYVPFLKQGTTLSLVITGLFLFGQCYRRLSNVLFSNRYMLFSIQIP